MNEKLKKLYDERLKIDTDQRKLLETADAEKRGLTPDEETNYQNMDKRFNDLKQEILAEETRDQDEGAHRAFRDVQSDLGITHKSTKLDADRARLTPEGRARYAKEICPATVRLIWR